MELDDLKTHKDNVADTMTEQLVDSLKKLHKEHPHDHQNDEELVVATEKPVKVCYRIQKPLKHYKKNSIKFN